MNEIEIFVNRLKNIGIEVELVANIPWIYLNKVNGNIVQDEDYNANHGYTVAWYPVRLGEEPYLNYDLKRTFEVLRKYKLQNKKCSCHGACCEAILGDDYECEDKYGRNKG